MDFVSQFRSSAPYIHAYRGITTVIWLREQALREERLGATISDLTLLHSLGLKLVLVFDEPLANENTRISENVSISSELFQELITSVSVQRNSIEAKFSQGVINSPMHGAKVRVISGNFVLARPAGVFNGEDLEAQGRVRRIDHLNIREQLNKQQIVLIPPIGYSITGEALYVPPQKLVVQLGKQLGAEKLMIVGENPHELTDSAKEISTSELKELLSRCSGTEPGFLELSAACDANNAGIARCHAIDASQDGALLTELFTRDGVGTLIALDQYDSFRRAREDDVQGILALLKPLEEKQVLVPREAEKIQQDISQFFVNERDGMIIGCAALHPLSTSEAELACVAVHPDYQKDGRGNALLTATERLARQEGLTRLYALTTQTEHWFVERGFRQVQVNDLPTARQELYNFQRNSKVYLKQL